MSRPPRFTQEQFESAYNVAQSLGDIAKSLYCSRLTVRSYCNKFGLPTNILPPGRPASKNTPITRPDEDIDALYLIAGPSSLRLTHQCSRFAKEPHARFRKRIIQAINWFYDVKHGFDRRSNEIPIIPIELSVKPKILIPVLKAWNTIRLNPTLFNKEPDYISKMINCAPSEFLPYLDACFNNNLLAKEKETKYAQID